MKGSFVKIPGLCSTKAYPSMTYTVLYHRPEGFKILEAQARNPELRALKFSCTFTLIIAGVYDDVIFNCYDVMALLIIVCKCLQLVRKLVCFMSTA